MTIDSIRAADGTDLNDRAVVDGTVLSVTLPTPVAPGESAHVEVSWETQLPRTLARMGHWGRHHDVMQWFPKLAVFSDEGWKVYPFYRHSEFYADFGTYEVTITAPENYLVEATGVPVGTRSNPDGTLSTTFHAEDVHDFAWIADPDARVAREVLDEGPYEDAPVEILYVHQPAHRRMAPRILKAVREGLRFYGRRLMPYPYPRIVLDDLPMGRGGGMEYPMLFTVSMGWFLPGFYTAPESLTLHEFGHQYWYGILASNEFEEPWLDEGINTYVTRRAMDAIYGSASDGRTVSALSAYAATRLLEEGLELRLGGGWSLNLDQLFGFHRTPFRSVGGGLLGYSLRPFDLDLPGLGTGRLERSRESYGEVWRDDPVVHPAWGFLPGSYAGTVYRKADVALETVSRLIGESVMDEALKTYVDRHRFAHPTSDDFFEVLREVTARHRPGLDLSPYIEQLFYGTGTVDWAVTSFRSREVRPSRGSVASRRVGESPIPAGAPEGARPGPVRYETEVIVRRLGDLVFPVDLSVRFENGEEERERWDGASTWKRFTYDTSARAERAVIDPDRIYVVDLDINNNGRSIDHQTRPVARLSLVWLFWLQNYLMLAAGLS